MSEAVIQATISFTFVLRFWHETTDGQVRWRGRIEHVQSGESAAFLQLDAMQSFLQRYGIGVEEPHPPTGESG